MDSPRPFKGLCVDRKTLRQRRTHRIMFSGSRLVVALRRPAGMGLKGVLVSISFTVKHSLKHDPRVAATRTAMVRSIYLDVSVMRLNALRVSVASRALKLRISMAPAQ